MSLSTDGYRSAASCVCRLGQVALAFVALGALSPPALAQVVLSVASPYAAKPEDNSHAERCLAALDLAMLAAESGIMDVSIDAMQRATAKGPPVAGMELGSLLGNNSRPRSASPSNSPRSTAAASAQAKLGARLLELHEVWKKKQVDPAAAYQAFKSLVFPAQRPSEAFPYAARLLQRVQANYSRLQYDVEEPKLEPCAATALVEWARLAGKEDDLLAEATARQPFPSAMTASLLVQILLAQQESRPVDEARALCEPLAAQVKLLVSGPDALLLFGHTWKMLARLPDDSPERKKLIAAALVSLRGDSNWAANEWLVFLVDRGLREALDSGDHEKFRSFVAIANSRFDNIRSNNADYVASQEASLYGWAARRAFAAGHLVLAADCLRLQHQLPVSQTYLQSQSDVILNPLQPVVQALLSLPRDERYGIIKSLAWKLPNLGMTRSTRLRSNEQIPQVFQAAAGDVPWRLIAGERARGASLLEWTMRDAIALGKQSEVEDEIKRLEGAGSDDARIARIVYRLAQDKPIDIAALLQARDTEQELRPVIGTSGPIVPLDLEIVEQALAQPEHRAAGLKLLDRLHDLANTGHQDVYVTLTRAIKLGLRDKPLEATQGDLAHWVVADDIKEADYTLGNPAQTLWIRRDDKTWGHEFGTNFSTLMLRYPLAGDYSIAFRVSDGGYAEGAASLSGRMIEFLEFRKRLQVWGLGHRNQTSFATDVLQSGTFNNIRLDRKGDTLTIHVNDRFEKQLDVPAADFPFFGLASYHYRASSFEGLAISGDGTIPRSVEMLTSGLVGWSARFKGEELPTMAITSETRPPDEDEKVDWRLVDGVVESLPRAEEKSQGKSPNAKYERPRRESVLQYLRPLVSGEEISLEFFHEPGKFTLAPALGRIAILLSGDKIGLHWITADPAGITTGIDDTNRVEDPAAQQPEPVALKSGVWNKLSLKLEGDEAVLAVNDQIVYRRTWEPEAGRLFGLFHEPAESQVRVRNVRLRGDWPERLPNDLFELKPRSETTSVQSRTGL